MASSLQLTYVLPLVWIVSGDRPPFPEAKSTLFVLQHRAGRGLRTGTRLRGVWNETSHRQTGAATPKLKRQRNAKHEGPPNKEPPKIETFLVVRWFNSGLTRQFNQV